MTEICKFKRQLFHTPCDTYLSIVLPFTKLTLMTLKLRIVTQQIAHLIEINRWHSVTVTPKYFIIFLVHNDTKMSLYECVHVDVM